MEESKIKITKKTLAEVEKLCGELFELIGLKVKAVVEHDKDNEAVTVSIEAPESVGLLIGRRGETVSAIQYVLGVMVRQKLGGWVRVLVNVGDWRQKQEEQLTALAISTAERARETGEAQLLYNLNPSQRRVVHLALADEKDLTSESEGEGRDRHLVIAVKK
ncbi:KH domain-containing protein [Candidatus Woesebacteria bacterium]|nr:KH domain-containing protein [Candidatus Woesebacteria bacterium]